MNWGSWALSAFVATIVLMTILGASQTMGLTRMNVLYLLGTMVTPGRERAKLVGAFLNAGNAMALSLLYVAIFHMWGDGWGRGALMGAVHGAFVLAVAMPLLPSIHPRMASEQHGPDPSRQLEPPGSFGFHYGAGTPLAIMLSHVAYGAILGLFYMP